MVQTAAGSGIPRTDINCTKIYKNYNCGIVHHLRSPQGTLEFGGFISRFWKNQGVGFPPLQAVEQPKVALHSSSLGNTWSTATGSATYLLTGATRKLITFSGVSWHIQGLRKPQGYMGNKKAWYRTVPPLYLSQVSISHSEVVSAAYQMRLPSVTLMPELFMFMQQKYVKPQNQPRNIFLLPCPLSTRTLHHSHEHLHHVQGNKIQEVL